MTIDEDTFLDAYTRNRPKPNDEQWEVIRAGRYEPQFVVAGPGTGKTTTLTLRILKLVLVEGVSPRAIVATTFTKKAAAELRSRILSWGYRLLDVLLNEMALPEESREQLRVMDINQVTTGTIDSICEELLHNFRESGTQPPVVADDFVSKTLMLREGLLSDQRYEDRLLDSFLFELSGRTSNWGWNIGMKNGLMQNIWERRYQDQVDWDQFCNSGDGPHEQQALQTLDEALSAYQRSLEERALLDFSLLEQTLLDQLRQGRPQEFLDQVKVVLVDEYQDTNLLQESLYFEMAKACDGALTVVGDDDQSLYRFRGATVQLFSDFPDRYEAVFGRRPSPTFLRINYRSTDNIVGLVNAYVTLDRAYQAVRVNEKPALSAGPKAVVGTPILSMFRQNEAELGEDLADFIAQIFRSSGYRLPDGSVIQRSANGGDLGDCALLCSSPAEMSSGNKPRLPLYLRRELQRKGIETFNPRGQDLTEIPLIQRFGGLLLECLDPGGVIQDATTGLTKQTQDVFMKWRDEAIGFAGSSDAPVGLVPYAVGWAERNPGRPNLMWPRTVPVLDLIYGLTHFFPELHDDPEGQIYLELFTRQVSACEQVGKFSGRVVTDSAHPGLAEAATKELLRDFLGPIAAGTITVNEELMDAFPRDRLSILSIHQAKGLEFPLTIVDVGAEFQGDYTAQRFKRFPERGATEHGMEDRLRPFSSLGEPARPGVDRAFDDLFRRFFVAFSRPQEVLLLVGSNKTAPGGPIRNVATGWDRTGTSHWHGNRPFILL